MAATYAKASFQRVDADDRPAGDRLDVQFNPADLTLSKGAQIAEIAIPGLDSPILQFVRGQNEKLTLELFFDSTEDGIGLGATPVTRQTNRFYSLVTMTGKEHAPPRLLFAWGQEFPGLVNQAAASADRGSGGSEVTGTRHAFRCVVETIQQKFTLFSPDGVPLRATLSVALREYKTLKHQLDELNLQSSDHTRVHIVQRGETLPQIAYTAYRDVSRWRVIAAANDLRDARDLEPGSILRLPPIRT